MIVFLMMIIMKICLYISKRFVDIFFINCVLLQGAFGLFTNETLSNFSVEISVLELFVIL